MGIILEKSVLRNVLSVGPSIMQLATLEIEMPDIEKQSEHWQFLPYKWKL